MSLVPSRSRLPLLAVAVAAIALPVAGCGSDDSSAGSGGADPAASMPATAPVYVEGVVRPDGDLASALQSTASKLSGRPDPGAQIVKAIDDELREDGASYAKDIEPWLGQRVGVAVTGLQGEDPDIILAAAVTDADKAQDAVESAGKGDEVRDYNGTTYRFDAARDRGVALIGETFVLATEAGMKDAIDAQAGQSLAESDRFKQAKAVAEDDSAAGFLFLDPNRTFDAFAQSAGLPQDQLGTARSALGQSGVKAVGAALRVSDDKLLLDAASIGGAQPPAAGDAAAAVAAAPAGSWLALGIGDVGGMVRKSIEQLTQAGGVGGTNPQELLDQLKTQAGFDVEQELLSWMGDARLFVRGSSLVGLNGALVVQSKDPAASAQAIGRIQQLMTQAGVPARTIAGGGLEVEIPGTGTLSIVSRGEQFIVAFGQGALEAALNPGDELGDSDAYKQAAGTLDGAQPSLFVDVPQIMALVESVAGSDPSFAQAKPTLDALGPMAVGTIREDDENRVQAGIVVK